MWKRRVGVLAVAAATAWLPAVPAHAVVGPKWKTLPGMPMPFGGVTKELRDIAAVSATEVWAVGAWRDAASHPLAARFDGAAWTIVPVPEPAASGQQFSLAAVDASESNRPWAVGGVRSGGSTSALVMHHDGTAWTVQPTPTDPAAVTSTLNDVDMLSNGDGWAVGRSTTAKPSTAPLILRRQAGRWSTVAPPVIDVPSAELTSVHAVSNDDVWAVGTQGSANGTRSSLVVHWNGARWGQVLVPMSGNGDDELDSVAATTPSDVWAVGRTCRVPSVVDTCRPLALRLSGGAWRVVPTSAGATELTGVVPFSDKDVWVVGYSGTPLLGESDHAQHWDGTRFVTDDGSVLTAPNQTAPNQTGPGIEGEPASALVAAAAVPGTGALWAVGWVHGQNGSLDHAIKRD